MLKHKHYTIVCSNINSTNLEQNEIINIEATGPLSIKHFKADLRVQPDGSTLFEEIDVYSLVFLKVFDSQGKVKTVHSNYKIYELSHSGDVLSDLTSKSHGNYPKLSQAAIFISAFENYNYEISSWIPANTLSWDIDKRILTIL